MSDIFINYWPIGKVSPAGRVLQSLTLSILILDVVWWHGGVAKARFECSCQKLNQLVG